MWKYMSVTSRQTSRKLTNGKASAMAGTRTGEEIARAARVEELRQLVASGRYRVEPARLALRILAKALEPR
jgi:anti-sigma28 factor (negative regulator of flagellin synthesis)